MFTRKIHQLTTRCFTLLFSASVMAMPDKAMRAGKWGVAIVPTLTNSKVLQFDNGAEADLNKRSGFGMYFGYNFNGHVELGGIFGASNSNYTGTRVIDDGNGTTEKFTANMYTSTLAIDLAYNFLKGPFTPYVNGFLGSTYIDSGIPTGDITTGCWWDPWWGYICAPVAQTYTSTRFNYGAGIGLRYDINRILFIKGGVTQNRLDISTANSSDFTTYQLYIGFKF